ncbi:TIGR02611 family protein [Streptomyces sp. NPDC004227]
MNTGSDEPEEPAELPGRAKAEAEAGEARERRGLGSRAPAFVRSRRVLHLGWQAGIFLAGLLVVIAGVVMLALPGPGWVVIFGGMAIWATEFVWAQLALRWTKRKVTEAAQQALDPEVRRRNIALTLTGLVIVAALAGVYVWRFGLVPPWDAGGR